MHSHAPRLCAALLAVTFLAPLGHAQADGANIYGFFQAQGQYNTTEMAPQFGGATSEDATFSIQQLNVFLANQFSTDFSAFVNTEVRNTLSTGDGFGELRLEEAWLRYHQSPALNIKAGRLIPTFNNLNEIKNRTPLVPYIFRPHVYESSYERTLAIGQFVPDQAYLQAYGVIPVGEVRADYAAYVGNGDVTNLASAEDAQIAGQDTTLSKLVGGRLGARWHGLKAGVSATKDSPQHGGFTIFGQPMEGVDGLGEMDRTRIGADLSFTLGRVFGEAEYIGVFYHLDDEQQAAVDAVSQASGGFIPNEFDGTFYYGLLGVNLTEKVFVYGRYDLFDEASFGNAVQAYNLGGGYRPIWPVVLKAQYHRVDMDNLFTSNYFFGAVSVSF